MEAAVKTCDCEQKIKSMELLIKHYENQLMMLKRRQFGVSSERVEIDGQLQLSLFGVAESQPADALLEPEIEEISYKRKKRIGKRDEDLSGLPVERIDYELPADKRGCPECGETMKDIGVDMRRDLKLVPAKVVVVEHATHAYACPNNDCLNENGNSVIVKADAPAPLLSGSLASPSLVAHIAVQKYLNATPLYRLEKGFLYDGVVISRQNMANWVIKCSMTYLYAFYLLLIKYLRQETVLHADETTVQVLKEPGRDPQTKSYEWIYRTSGYSERKIVIYDYKETRKREHPAEFLRDFNGYLHTDGYEVYHGLHPGIIVVGCFAHVRRRWEKLFKSIHKDHRKGTDAERGLTFINRLFDLERKFKGLSPPERYKKRLEESKPIADAFFEWADKLGTLPKSPLGEAVHYSLSQRKYLDNVFLDGRTELSNNRAERTVKSFVIGRKNWLFSDSVEGATASSIMYSIIETAKENELHPFRYLKYLLEVLPNSNASELEAVLPWSAALPDFCRASFK